jgi:hypothetical protein
MVVDPKGLMGCPMGQRSVPAKNYESLYPDVYTCIDDPGSTAPPYCPSGDCAFYPPETNCSFTKDCYNKVMQGSFWGKVSFKLCEAAVGKSGIPYAKSIVCQSIVWAACGQATHAQCAGCGPK